MQIKPELDEIGTVVYVFRAGDTNRFKIGRATNVEARRKQLQTGCPDKLELVGTIEGDAVRIESEFHKMFDEYRRTGEWFEFDDASLICRFFPPTIEADSKALEFLILSMTEIHGLVANRTLLDNQSFTPVLRFEVVPKDPYMKHAFWDYYRTERSQQLHKSPILAVADFVDAFKIWPGRIDSLKKMGETYYVGKAVSDFACPRCRQPIKIAK